MSSKITFIAACFIASCLLPSFFYSQSGSLDNSFGTGGIVTTSIGASNDYGQSVAIQTDGKIVVAGSTGPDFAIVRYNTNGTLDNTFGTSGKVISSIAAGNDVGAALAIQTDGKIVVGGYTGNFPNYDLALARYNTNGSIDNTFGTAGVVTTTVGSAGDVGRSITIQSDGKIILAGNSDNGTNNDVALVRYNTNGTLDNTFDTDGKVTTAVGTANDIARSVVVQSDGKILITGYSYINASFSYDFVIIRYNTDGSLDNTFGTAGVVTTGVINSTNDYGEKILLQSDGKIIVGGYSFTGSIVMARYNSNGTLDNTFGAIGTLTTNFACAYQNNYSAALQSDGKILIGGYSTLVNSPSDFALIRYNTNGTIDNTFGTAGMVNTAIGTSTDIATSVAVQADGKIVLAGSSYNGTNFDFAITRYNDIITGINTNENVITQIKAYPNPFSVTATIHLQTEMENAYLTIYNMFGQIVKNTKVIGDKIKIDRDSLPNGVYFVRLMQNNKIIATEKLVITD